MKDQRYYYKIWDELDKISQLKIKKNWNKFLNYVYCIKRLFNQWMNLSSNQNKKNLNFKKFSYYLVYDPSILLNGQIFNELKDINTKLIENSLEQDILYSWFDFEQAIKSAITLADLKMHLDLLDKELFSYLIMGENDVSFEIIQNHDLFQMLHNLKSPNTITHLDDFEKFNNETKLFNNLHLIHEEENAYYLKLNYSNYTKIMNFGILNANKIWVFNGLSALEKLFDALPIKK